MKGNWVPATRPNQVPKHNQISKKRRNRENNMGKTLLQKEIAIIKSEWMKFTKRDCPYREDQNPNRKEN